MLNVSIIFSKIHVLLQWEKLDAVAVVFDVTNPTSLENSLHWLDLVKANLDPKLDLLGVLIGNKTDYGEERTVTTKKAQDYADEIGLKYFEVTAVSFSIQIFLYNYLFYCTNDSCLEISNSWSM